MKIRFWLCSVGPVESNRSRSAINVLTIVLLDYMVQISETWFSFVLLQFYLEYQME